MKTKKIIIKKQINNLKNNFQPFKLKKKYPQSKTSLKNYQNESFCIKFYKYYFLLIKKY